MLRRMNEQRTAAPRHPILSLIGNTALLPLHFAEEKRTILAKAEYLNPSGSIKDRLALCLLEDAEKRGLINKDSIILECTSGNTGIALAMVGTVMGYKVHILMSDTASVERRYLMQQFGATIQLFKATKGYATGIELADKMAAENPHIFLTKQFENPVNALDHEQHTAKEIVAQLRGPAQAFVAGYGTGGTLTGCSRGLRKVFPEMKTYAMEPAEAAMLSGESPCCHLIEGIAGGYVPPLLAGADIDGVIKVKSSEAIEMTRRLTREFGLLVGTSSGANVAAALRIAQELPEDSRVVTILCDRAERYYSTKLFA